MGVIILCAALGAAIATACKAANKKSAEGQMFDVSTTLIVKGLSHDVELGTMREGEIVTKKIHLKNVDAQPLVIKDIKTGCACLTFEYSREPVKTGDAATIEVIFDSRGYGGEIVRDVDVYTSAARLPLWLKVMATIK